MFFYTISIAAAIFILMIVVTRLAIHFYFCRRVSFRYPGEKITGCPIWTHADKKGDRGNSGDSGNTAANSTQHIITQNNHSDKREDASLQFGTKDNSSIIPT